MTGGLFSFGKNSWATRPVFAPLVSLAVLGALAAPGCRGGGDSARVEIDDGIADAGPAASNDAGSRMSHEQPSAPPPSMRRQDAGMTGAGDEDASVADDPTKRAGRSEPDPIDPNQQASSQYCGDGIRGLLDEECDDGNTDDTDMCTSACVRQNVLAVLPQYPEVGIDAGIVGPYSRYLGSGRHPVASDAGGFAVVYVEPDFEPPRIGLSAFSPVGERWPTTTTGEGTLISDGTTPVLFSDPVVAALPDGYAVAYTDFGNDGDLLGVALRRVDVSSMHTEVHPVQFANTTTAFSQLDADILWTGSELVVAWTDEADAFYAPDLIYRRFDENLEPLDDEERILAATEKVEGSVALGPYKGGWAAAYREGEFDTATERIVVTTGDYEWRTEPFAPPQDLDKPAVMELDSSHLLVAFTKGTDSTGDAGVPNETWPYMAVLNTAGPFEDVPIEPLEPSPQPGAFNSVDLARVNSVVTRYYSAIRLENFWNTDDTITTKELAWDPTLEVLDNTITSNGLGMPGDQRNLHLAPSSLDPEGALVMVWDDHFSAADETHGQPDVFVTLMPVPEMGSLPAHCSNGVKDADETGNDCGGADCEPCPS